MKTCGGHSTQNHQISKLYLVCIVFEIVSAFIGTEGGITRPGHLYGQDSVMVDRIKNLLVGSIEPESVSNFAKKRVFELRNGKASLSHISLPIGKTKVGTYLKKWKHT